MNKIKNRIGYLSLLLSATLLVVGCGSSSSGPSKNSGTGSIDLAKYFPSDDMSKTFTTVDGNTSDFTSGHYENMISVVTDNNITTITTLEDGKNSEKVVITDKNITQSYGKTSFSGYRHVNIGDTFFKFKDEESKDINKYGSHYAKVTNRIDFECTIEEQLNKFSKGEHKYTGDLLKVKCINNGKITVEIDPSLISNLLDMNPNTVNIIKDINGTHDNYNISYHYFKKDIGDIASIDEDCIVVSKEPKWQDDRKAECAEKRRNYEYFSGN